MKHATPEARKRIIKHLKINQKQHLAEKEIREQAQRAKERIRYFPSLQYNVPLRLHTRAW